MKVIRKIIVIFIILISLLGTTLSFANASSYLTGEGGAQYVPGDNPYPAGQQAEKQKEEERKRQEAEQKKKEEEEKKKQQQQQQTSGTGIIDPVTNPDEYNPTDPGESTEFVKLGGVILGAIRVFGSAVAVIALMVIGIRYMMGSASEKAEFKETMIPYIIGAIMLFAIPNILGILYDLIKNNITL